MPTQRIEISPLPKLGERDLSKLEKRFRIPAQDFVSSIGFNGLEDGAIFTDNVWADSLEPLAIYLKLIEDWRRGDIEAILSVVNEDVIWHFSTGGAAPVRGKARVREWVENHTVRSKVPTVASCTTPSLVIASLLREWSTM